MAGWQQPPADGDPTELACPVLRCRKPGQRWMVLHEHWRLAACADHADDIEARPERWRLADGVPSRGLRITPAYVGDPPDWRRDRKEDEE